MDEATPRSPDERRNVKREARRARWEEASRDPLFLRDLAETAAAVASAEVEIADEAPGSDT
jgi:hypothetical protein